MNRKRFARLSDPSPPCAQSSIEPLEARTMLSSSFPNVDVAPLPGNQSEGAIAIDRTNSSRLFALSNTDSGDGLSAALSSDGGVSWTSRLIATGSDGLDPACCDPSACFDQFGNLFVTYLNMTKDHIRVIMSTDGGLSFSNLASFEGEVDQPTVVAGAGEVWVMFARGLSVVTSGAAVTGLGQVGQMSALQTLPGSRGGAFGDIAIGPAGQVMVTYQRGSGNHSRIGLNVDPDGIGPQSFGKRVDVASVNVGAFLRVPAQPHKTPGERSNTDTNLGGVDAEASLGFDRSSGAFNSRAYLVYTDRFAKSGNNTDIFLRYSDDNGEHWSNAIRVNDDRGFNSQILPRLSVDDTTGMFAVSWHDCRNDGGAHDAGDTDGIPNDDVQMFATVGTPVADGVRLSPNQQISAGTSNAAAAQNTIDLGDYTGLDFFAGVLHPFWADNSNSTGNNPANSLAEFDMDSAAVPATAFQLAAATSLGGFASGNSPALAFKGKTSTKARGAYKFKVTFSSPAGIDLATVGAALVITGPNGFAAPVALLKARSAKGGAVVASYRVLGRGPDRSIPERGIYTLSLIAGVLKDLSGNAADGGIIADVAVV